MLVISDARGVLMWIEGHRRVIEATDNMHFVAGADWSESGAGTNALGTAIAVDHPVQIFSAEHFSRVVHPVAVLGRADPRSGDRRDHRRDRPHRAPAHRAPAHAQPRHRRGRHGRGVPAPRAGPARRAHRGRRISSASPGARERTALVRASGQVLMAVPPAGSPAGPARRGPGRELAARRRHASPTSSRCPATTRSSSGAAAGRRGRQAHGRGPARAAEPPPAAAAPRRDGARCPAATPRSSATLLLAGRGLTAEELTPRGLPRGRQAGHAASRDEPAARRARRPAATRARTPSRVPVTSDLQEAEALLAHGRLARGAGARRASGCCPTRRAPRVVEARERLEQRPARRRAGGGTTPALLEAWCGSAPRRAGRRSTPPARWSTCCPGRRAAARRARTARAARELAATSRRGGSRASAPALGDRATVPRRRRTAPDPAPVRTRRPPAHTRGKPSPIRTARR